MRVDLMRTTTTYSQTKDNINRYWGVAIVNVVALSFYSN